MFFQVSIYIYRLYFQVDSFWLYVHFIVVWFVWLVDFAVSIHSTLTNWDLLAQIHIRSICSGYLLRCRWRIKFTPEQKTGFELSALHFSSAFNAYMTTVLSHLMQKTSGTPAAGAPVILVIQTSQDTCFWTTTDTHLGFRTGVSILTEWQTSF